MDVVGGEWVRWFWGLTCDFWAKNEKNNFGAMVKVMKSVASLAGYARDFGKAERLLVFRLKQRRDFLEEFLKEAVAIIYKAADDLHGSGFFVGNRADVAFVEGEDLCAGVSEQDGRVGGDDELSVFVAA